MTTAQVLGSGLVVRPYQVTDELQVLGLLTQTLSGWSSRRGGAAAEYWRWKHFKNPFGTSMVRVAWLDRVGIVGVLAMMRWRLLYDNQVIKTARSVDMATHPDYRGMGVATRLSSGLGEDVRADGTSLIFSTPNRASLGISQKLGRKYLGTIRPSIRVTRVLGLLLRHVIRPARPKKHLVDFDAPHMLSVRSWLDRGDAVERLLEHDSPADRFRTLRTREYLRWRYGEQPLGNYYALNVEERGELVGAVIFRVVSGVRASGIVIQETIVKGRDFRIASALNRRLREVNNVSFFSGCVSHDPLERTVLGGGSAFRQPRWGYNLTVGALAPEFSGAAQQLSAWGLTLGDLEGF